MSRKGGNPKKKSFRARNKIKKGQKKVDAFAGAMLETSSSGGRVDRVLAKCRKTGNLNLSSFKLSALPDAIYHLGEKEDAKQSGTNWWECEPISSFNVSHNSLTAVPEEISTFIELTNINFHDNQLHTVCPDIADLEKLVKLDLSRNQLAALPEAFPETLVSLYLQENNLTALPPVIATMPKLRILNVSSNKLQALPQQGRLPVLQDLKAESNILNSLPNWLSQCTSLTNLDVQKNKLTSIPNLSQLHQLSNCRLTLNRLTVLPSFSDQSPLITLEVNDNRLTNIDSVLNQHKLVNLYLSTNKLKELSPAMENLSKLKILDVKMNDLENVPAEFGRMTVLNSFEVEGNPLRRIQRGKYANGTDKFKKYLLTRLVPTEEKKAENVKKQSKLSVQEAIKAGNRTRSISLQSQNIKTIPEDVWEVENIRILDFSQNNLENANEGLDDIAVFEDSLQQLILDKNKYTSLPMAIVSLSKLKKLSINNNQISTLPKEFSGLSNLSELSLSRNRFRELPSSILNMTALNTLAMANNGLTYLPSLQGMPNLRSVQVRGNRITKIAEGIHKMKQLSFIDLQDNQLRRIPIELAACPSLKALLINGNPQKMISRTIVDQGSTQVLAALRHKIPDGSPLLGNSMGGGQQQMGQMGGRSTNMMGRGMGRASPNMMGRGMGGRSPNMMGRGMGGRSPNMMGRGNSNMMGGRGSNMMGRSNPNMMGGRNTNMMGGRSPNMGGRSPNMGGRNPNMMGQSQNQSQVAALKQKIQTLENNLKNGVGLRKAQKYRMERELEKTRAALKAQLQRR